MISVKQLKSEKNLLFFKNSFFNYITTSLTIVINLFLIPLMLSVLGKESFGIWQTILSIISLVSLLNFGLGNGLRNLITKLKVQNSENIGDAIGATIKKISKIIFFTALVLIPTVYFFIRPDSLFINSHVLESEIKYSILVFLCFFLLNIILSLSNSVAYGLHKSYLTGVMQLSYLTICYALIIILGHFYVLNLINISFIFGLTQSVIYFVFLFYQNYKFKLNINFNNNYDLKETSSLSFNFFIAQALALVFLSVDNFVISSTLGPNDTAEFSVVNKIYFTLISLFSVLLIHFWNSVTEAFEKKEMQWIYSTIKILLAITTIVFIAGLIIAFFQESILNLWLGTNVFHITSLTFYLFSIYTLFHCVNAVFVNIQNGLGFLKIQIFSTFLSLMLYGMGCYFIDIKHYGYNSIIALKLSVMALSAIINASVLLKLKKE